MVNWILNCVSTVSYALLVNGSPTNSFKPSWGLRQGDLLSPYPFLFCANILSLALLQAENEKLIKGVKVGKQGCSFIHLLFVDDSLLFFHNDHSSHDNLRKTIKWYCKISCQSINHQKSELFCSPNLTKEEKNSLDQCLQVNLVQKPSKYLGVNFKLRGKRIPRSCWDATK